MSASAILGRVVQSQRSLNRIVLLAPPKGATELQKFLRLHNRGLSVVHVATREELIGLSPEMLGTARLIGFATDVIVPSRTLDLLGFDAYNFHPGPPSHPGWAPACFAIYDGARLFGGTAHRMIAKVDAGPIVGVELFPVRPGVTPRQLEREAIIAMLHLFRRLGPTLATSPEPLPALAINWGQAKRRRADLARMRETPLYMSEEERARRLRSFAMEDDRMVSNDTRNGRFFCLTPPRHVAAEVRR